MRIIFSFAFALHFNPFDPTLEQKDAKKCLKFREFSLANKQSKGRERVSLPICHLLELCNHSFEEYDDLGNSALNDLPF